MASELTGKLAEEQRKQLATYYVRQSVDEANAFLRARHKKAETRNLWAMNVLNIAAGNLARLGEGDHYRSERLAAYLAETSQKVSAQDR